jgi:formylglycine-generating enzyme required for sulfatase activity
MAMKTRETRTFGGRSGVRAGVALVAFGAAAGCQALVGIESSQVSDSDSGAPSKIDSGGALIPVPPEAGPDTSAAPNDTGVDADDSSDADAADTAVQPCTCAPDASATDAADAADAAECASGDRRCNGNTLQKCGVGARWEDETTCAVYCRNAQCEVPPSCSQIQTTCGTPADERSCCSAHLVAGGSFKRDYDGTTSGHTDSTYSAVVSSFLLDDFEVTVERFSRFVNAYPIAAPDAGAPHGSMPAPGAGKNPSDPTDTGWNAAWPLPKDRAELTSLLTTGPACDLATWGPPSHKPLTCATWYLAYAFCIWDGGRLPTEAEWNYAAAGGGGADGQRVYPWSSPPVSLTITPDDAVYQALSPDLVGSRLPKGAGKWLQADLGGNLSEWVADAYVVPYAKNPCEDCGDHTEGVDRSTRGGDYTGQNTLSRVGIRSSAPPELGFGYLGFRCARSK